MKKLAAVAGLFLCVVLCGAIPCFAQKQGEEKKAEAAKTEEPKVAAPVAADSEFFEALDDLNLINAEIARIERANGNVEVPNSVDSLRERAKLKAAHLQKWVKDHGVDGWRFDAQGKQFLPPIAEAKPAGPGTPPTPAAEGKK